MRPFRFAASTNGGTTRRELEETARRAEDLGYFALHINDHYLGPGPALDEAHHPPQTFAAIPTALVVADATRTIRVGFRVLCADYHNPTVLAKTLSTLDLFSDGRIEVGLGAGWMAAEYEALGIRYDAPMDRIRRLGEVIQVLRACFSPGILEVVGSTGVRSTGFEATPPPIQRHGPPIAVGGGGRRILELAARTADIVCFNRDNRAGRVSVQGARLTTAEAALAKMDWVRSAAGERFPRLELEVGAKHLTVTSDTRSAARSWAKRLGIDEEETLIHPFCLLGSTQQICDTIQERRERFGWNYYTILDHDLEAFAPVVEQLDGR